MRHKAGNILKGWVKSRRLALVYFVVYTAILLLVYGLYGYPWGTAGYAVLLSLVAGAAIAVYDLQKFAEKKRTLEKLAGRFPLGELPQADALLEQEYQDIVLALEQERLRITALMEKQHQQDEEYHMLWAHQIKTPIAAIRLVLQHNSGELPEEFTSTLETELFRIEQYVEMVLQYLRLANFQGDLVLEYHSYSALVKKAAKNLAPLFIHKNLPLEIQEMEGGVVTDEKWMVFVLEQLLANAVKYTASGKISAYLREGALCIEDTGIGISKSDLPRVFERGYTGAIGRVENRSTGIGLYLCKEIAGRLGLSIQLESEQGRGTVAVLRWEQQELYQE